MFLPSYVLTALGILKQNGIEGYAVGGCVRDALLGSVPDDYDIAVSCRPEKTKECFKDFKVIETGIRHGTVTVVIEKHNLELTSFRVDGEYKDMRRPEDVTFTPFLKEDLSRRDFTVNAMAYSPETGTVDLFGGREDLKKKLIRCVGEPDKRFGEDALRILRALRFSSVLGFSIEENTAASVIKNRDNLKKISAERVFVELKKLLEGKNSFEVLKKYKSVLASVIPELIGVPDDEYALCAEKASELKNGVLSFAAILLPLGEDKAERILRALKTDNAFRETAVFLIANAKTQFTSIGEARRFLGKYGKKPCERLVLFKNAFGSGDAFLQEALENNGGALKTTDLKIKGRDLERLGFTGKEIGEALERLLGEVSEDRLANEKAELLAFCLRDV
ncbi:MAG: hypothetical protein IJS90_09340 [Clostridia bacterium]|nr:hypothetical protein [Clostridia bacterium]